MRRQPRVWMRAGAGCVVLGLLVSCGRAIEEQAPRPEGGLAASVAAPGLVDRAAHTATTATVAAVVVAGGCVVDGCSEATASTFIVASHGYRETDAMGTARDAHVGVRLRDGTVLVAGGFAGENQPPLVSGETYDLTTGHWSATGDMVLGRGGHAAALLGTGRVLVAGGWVRPRTFTETTEIFDPVSRQFTAGPSLPAPTDGLTATSLDDGTVLVVGGQVSPDVATGQAVVVSEDGRRAELVGKLATPRFKHAAVKLPSGQVLIVGGTKDDNTLLPTTEIYDPETRSFRAGPTMSNGRYKLAGGAATLPDGRVVVAGSAAGLEIIDISRFTSRLALAETVSPSSFATTSVIGGNLRVIGGYDRSIRLSRTDLTTDIANL